MAGNSRHSNVVKLQSKNISDLMMTNPTVPVLHLVAKGGGRRRRQGDEGRGAALVVTVLLDHKFS